MYLQNCTFKPINRVDSLGWRLNSLIRLAQPVLLLIDFSIELLPRRITILKTTKTLIFYF